MKRIYARRNPSLLVFTDLDGTLLDHKTYSFAPALPVLHTLEERNIPVIFCTSKTRAETEMFRRELHNTHPFISENGGAVYIPKDYFPHNFPYTKKNADYLTIELGTPYPRLRKAFLEMKSRFPDTMTGFGDLSSEEVADLCGIPPSYAELAKQREYDEPFLLKAKTLEGPVRKMAEEANLQVTQGGRFYHLMGNNDKGKAVRLLKNLYKKKSRNLKAIALGDNLNDLPMLEAADFPVLIQKPDGSYDPSVKLAHLTYAPDCGPAGWSKALCELLQKLSGGLQQ
ncbi:MAG: HAD-IIB family hydrolase [Candidatus Aminicenantales bacterium]